MKDFFRTMSFLIDSTVSQAPQSRFQILITKNNQKGPRTSLLGPGEFFLEKKIIQKIL